MLLRPTQAEHLAIGKIIIFFFVHLSNRLSGIIRQREYVRNNPDISQRHLRTVPENVVQMRKEIIYLEERQT